jgi:hypothetical protein
MLAHIRRQVSLIGVTGCGCDLRKAVGTRGYLAYRTVETLDGGVSLWRQSRSITKMPLKGTRDDAGRRGNISYLGRWALSRCIQDAIESGRGLPRILPSRG